VIEAAVAGIGSFVSWLRAVVALVQIQASGEIG
jgi:hypothetical protein